LRRILRGVGFIPLIALPIAPIIFLVSFGGVSFSPKFRIEFPGTEQRLEDHKKLAMACVG
jgi:hypothetical protein